MGIVETVNRRSTFGRIELADLSTVRIRWRQKIQLDIDMGHRQVSDALERKLSDSKADNSS